MPTMSSTPKPASKPSFELFRQVEDGLWIATKRGGDYRGGQFLAVEMADFTSGVDDATKEGFLELMHNANQVHAISQILNHENIVSLVGHIQTHPFIGDPILQRAEPLRNYLVWDYCDAANLSCLLMGLPCNDSQHYLPESLCWHVLVSLMRAITFLHDGKRLVVDYNAEPSKARQWMGMDQDWYPILHRNITPGNVYFQHPRGIETYGACKLGNFQDAAVTAHMISPGGGPDVQDEDVSFSIALASGKGWEPLTETGKKMKGNPNQLPQDKRPYTLKDELFAIGGIVFTMMTGKSLPLSCPYCSRSHIYLCAQGGCLQATAVKRGCNCADGGCEHMPKESCTHGYPQRASGGERSLLSQCTLLSVNIDGFLMRARYSWRLRRMVKELLDYHPPTKMEGCVMKVLPLMLLVEDHYREWKDEMERGDEYGYRDIEDDMSARMEATMGPAPTMSNLG